MNSPTGLAFHRGARPKPVVESDQPTTTATTIAQNATHAVRMAPQKTRSERLTAAAPVRPGDARAADGRATLARSGTLVKSPGLSDAGGWAPAGRLELPPEMRGSAGAMGGIVGYPVPARLKTSVCESSSAESRLKPDRIHHFFTTDDESSAGGCASTATPASDPGPRPRCTRHHEIGATEGAM
jgi:hypothetical protein